MKLTALGIDSMEFDSERAINLSQNVARVYLWLQEGEGGKKICEAAAILNKLVTRPSPLTQFRGLKFEDPAVADALLGGNMASKHPCESWTTKPHIAQEFASDVGPRPVFRFIMMRKFSRNEIILDVEGCLLYTSPSPRDRQKSRMPSSA